MWVERMFILYVVTMFVASLYIGFNNTVFQVGSYGALGFGLAAFTVAMCKESTLMFCLFICSICAFVLLSIFKIQGDFLWLFGAWFVFVPILSFTLNYPIFYIEYCQFLKYMKSKFWIGTIAITNHKREIKVKFSSKEIESIFITNQNLLPESIRSAIADGYEVDFAVEARAIRRNTTLSCRDNKQKKNAVKN